MKKILILTCVLLTTLGTTKAIALTIINMKFEYDVAMSEDVYFELYDESAPLNVNNFLGYVNRGDYNGSFLHRKATKGDDEIPFVLQGGGFTYDPVIDFDARFCALFGTTLLNVAGNENTGELGLRPIDEPYFVDSNNDDDPDDFGVGAGTLSFDFDCAKAGDIFRFNTGLQSVPVDTSSLPVLSEFSTSNARGTLAMALTSAGEDSATNQWFINMDDNPGLDSTTAGPFTVFGRVLEGGMTVFDDIFARTFTVPIAGTVIGPDFRELPVINYPGFDLVLNEHLIKLSEVEEIIHIDLSGIDFGFVPSGMNGQTVINVSVPASYTSGVEFDSIAVNNIVASPFTLSTNCDSALIAAGGNCTITIDFDPVIQAQFYESFDISFTSPAIPALTVELAGTSQLLPSVSISPEDQMNFQFVNPGSSKQKTVTLTNIGQQDLVFDTMQPFILDDTDNFSFTHNCSVLLSTESCDLTVTFNPQQVGILLGSINIVSNEVDSPRPLLLVGAGAGVSNVLPDIDGPVSLAMGDAFNGAEIVDSITLENTGGSELIISGIQITGTDAVDFAYSSICDQLQIDETCEIDVRYLASHFGDSSATLTVISDDPDESDFVITLIASNSKDSDEVPDSVELGAPNSGDGNNDGTTDDLQSNVASLEEGSSTYITLFSSDTTTFSGVKLIDLTTLDSLPQGVSFKHGAFGYEINGLTFGETNVVGFLLPEGETLESYYQYGVTPDNTTPHWYEFTFDGISGAQASTQVIVGENNGVPVKRTLVQVWYLDGARGDGDLTADGSIAVIGGVSLATTSSSSSIGGLLLMLMLSHLFYFRFYRQ